MEQVPLVNQTSWETFFRQKELLRIWGQGCTDQQTDRQREIDKETDTVGQTNRQTDRQDCWHIWRCKNCFQTC